MRLEYVIFYGPYLIASLLTGLAIIVWRRNLGPTPLAWGLIAGAIVLVSLGLVLPIGIWLGDI